jgi:hypothetical protein
LISMSSSMLRLLEKVRKLIDFGFTTWYALVPPKLCPWESHRLEGPLVKDTCLHICSTWGQISFLVSNSSNILSWSFAVA